MAVTPRGTDPDHTGPCALDFDSTGDWLVCAYDGTRSYNLKKAINRNTVIVQLHQAGQLRQAGWAERVANEYLANNPEDQ